MFQLTNEEFENLRCQNGTSSWGGARYAPYAFTEQGVAMLSSVLNSGRAITLRQLLVPVEQVERERIGFRQRVEGE